MKSFLFFFIIAICHLSLMEGQESRDIDRKISSLKSYFSEREYDMLMKNDDDYVYVPDDVKQLLKDLNQRYPEIVHHEMVPADELHIVSEVIMDSSLHTVIQKLSALEYNNEKLLILRSYYADVEAGHAFIFMEEESADDPLEHDESNTLRRKKKCKIYCTLLVRNCLRVGSILIAGDVKIDGSITVDGLIDNIGESAAGEFTGGQDGQLFIARTGGAGQFDTITSSNGSVVFTPGPGTLGLQAKPFLGNIARVDQIYGNDSIGAVSGPAFATITAALAAAAAHTDPVVVWVFPGTYSDTSYYPETFPLTIAENVSLVGISRGGVAGAGGVTIEKIDANVATTLIDMQAHTLIDNLTLKLTGSTGKLVGINVQACPCEINRISMTVNSIDGDTSGIETSGDGGVTIDAATITTESPYTVGIHIKQNNVVTTKRCNIQAEGNSLDRYAVFIEDIFNIYYQDSGSILHGYYACYGSSISSTRCIVLGTTLINDVFTPPYNSNLYEASFALAPGCAPTILVWNIYASNILARGFMAPGSFNQVIPITNSPSDSNVGYLLIQPGIIVNLYAALTSQLSGGSPLTFGLSKATEPSVLSSSFTISPGQSSANLSLFTNYFSTNVILRIALRDAPTAQINYPMFSCVLY